MLILGGATTPLTTAIVTTVSLLVVALAQLFFLSLSLEIYWSSSASASA